MHSCCEMEGDGPPGATHPHQDARELRVGAVEWMPGTVSGTGGAHAGRLPDPVVVTANRACQGVDANGALPA